MLTCGGINSDGLPTESTEILSTRSDKYEGLNSNGGASAITGCDRLGAKLTVLCTVSRVAFQNSFTCAETAPLRIGPYKSIPTATSMNPYTEPRQNFFKSSLMPGLRDANCGAEENSVWIEE